MGWKAGLPYRFGVWTLSLCSQTNQNVNKPTKMCEWGKWNLHTNYWMNCVSFPAIYMWHVPWSNMTIARVFFAIILSLTSVSLHVRGDFGQTWKPMRGVRLWYYQPSNRQSFVCLSVFHHVAPDFNGMAWSFSQIFKIPGGSRRFTLCFYLIYESPRLSSSVLLFHKNST